MCEGGEYPTVAASQSPCIGDTSNCVFVKQMLGRHAGCGVINDVNYCTAAADDDDD